MSWKQTRDITERKYKTCCDYQNLPHGSMVTVIKENKKTLRVQWSSMNGTYRLTIPKSIVIWKGPKPKYEARNNTKIS